MQLPNYRRCLDFGVAHCLFKNVKLRYFSCSLEANVIFSRIYVIAIIFQRHFSTESMLSWLAISSVIRVFNVNIYFSLNRKGNVLFGGGGGGNPNASRFCCSIENGYYYTDGVRLSAYNKV